ncbi:MAG: selenide, water dikinase SelD [Pseudomonadales bacterium]
MRSAAPPVLDMVLLGGGHSHVQVLRAFGMRPLEGVRVTVVSREVFTPYSGMLPGHVAGLYDWRDIHIDLGPLARFAGARLIAAEAVALDADARRIEFADRPALHYDVLSINSGAVPAHHGGAGVPVKPIGRFLPHWRALRERIEPGQRVALVGGGAGGIELALAMRRSLSDVCPITLLTDSLLPGFPAGAVRRLAAALAAHDVEVLQGFKVAEVQELADGNAISAADGRRLHADFLFWVTGVEPPPWLQRSGLATDSAGFVAVDRQLRSTSHADVFAAGDVAGMVLQPRPKSGVFAVRQGPVLAANLRRVVSDRPLRRYRAQRRALAIVGTADGSAVAARGALALSGPWVWRWKDWIDRRFMARFRVLPDMPEAPLRLPGRLQERLPDPMRCGGCGAKLGADPLRRVLARLPDQAPLEARRGVIVGIGDDAAVVRVSGADLVMTVDGFRSVVDDAYRFGRITAHHSLNDVIAMGGTGLAALAMATVPLMTETMMEEELFALLKGAVEVLNAHDVPLVGGHSAEGGELALALSITGVEGERPLRKGACRPGDALLLTKPLGTGAVLAADMRGKAASDVLDAALSSMDHSNAAALEVLREHDLRALTDVSGFGLLGHLGEMLRAAGLGARVAVSAVPLLPGAAELVAAGIVSSLQANNEQALGDYDITSLALADPRLRLLVDPQTSGGLLAALPSDRAEACRAALVAAGYSEAALIGEVTAGGWQVMER